MKSQVPSPPTKPKSSAKALAVITAILVVFCVPLGAVFFFSQLDNSSKIFYKGIGADLRKGDFALSTSKATAERNLAASAIKVDEAKTKLEAALLLQKQHQEADKASRAAHAAKREQRWMNQQTEASKDNSQL